MLNRNQIHEVLKEFTSLSETHGTTNSDAYKNAKKTLDEFDNNLEHREEEIKEERNYKMSSDNITQTHPAFGSIHAIRSGGQRNTNLYGSSIMHSNTITITIQEAINDRNLNNDWHHPTNTIIEVEVSQTQFAEFITSMNVGSGIPCTIRRRDGYIVPAIKSSKGNRDKFISEFKQTINKTFESLETIKEEIESITSKKGALNVAEKKEISDKVNDLTGKLKGSLPFIHDQFNEAMDKTSLEAKGEVEAFFQNKINSLGIESLKANPNQLFSIEDNSDE